MFTELPGQVVGCAVDGFCYSVIAGCFLPATSSSQCSLTGLFGPFQGGLQGQRNHGAPEDPIDDSPESGGTRSTRVLSAKLSNDPNNF